MSNVNDFIQNVNSSRKRTGILYTSGLFTPIIEVFESKFPDLNILDCSDLYMGTLIYSPKELLDMIESKSYEKYTLVFNIETFIVVNSGGFINKIANLMTYREPTSPLFYFFYSKKIFSCFKDEFEAKEMNKNNILEF